MNVKERFIEISALMCEPTRAKMLWSLLDGRAYTANELAIEADISPSSASNHLSKLLRADLLKVESQGRHRYYSFMNTDVAYTVESMANLAGGFKYGPAVPKEGIKYCRTCYDHMAGYVGVRLTEMMIAKGILSEIDSEFEVTPKGWDWATALDIGYDEMVNARRPIARKCLDWSERKPHLAGQFGAELLEKFLERRWVQRVNFSRELILTGEGKRQFDLLLNLRL